MGTCTVEVITGHDMRPGWGYPYTATDDIWIRATDTSGRGCDGFEIPITYLWCSCPENDVEQSSIEATENEWNKKYDRLCTADAAYYDGQNPTHSIECADCSVRIYHAEFPRDNGVKFWTGTGSCEGSFQIDLEQSECYTTGRHVYSPPALACAGQCEDTSQ
jgi:hypothetical protein